MGNTIVNYKEEVEKLSDDNRQILEHILEALNEDGKKVFKDAVESKTGMLEYFINNYKQKIEAFQKASKEDLDDLVAKDLEMVEKLDAEE